MKRILAFVLCSFLALILCACTENFVHVDTSSDVSTGDTDTTVSTGESVSSDPFGTVTENNSTAENSTQAQSGQVMSSKISSTNSVVKEENSKVQESTSSKEENTSSNLQDSSSQNESKPMGSIDPNDPNNFWGYNSK